MLTFWPNVRAYIRPLWVLINLPTVDNVSHMCTRSAPGCHAMTDALRKNPPSTPSDAPLSSSTKSSFSAPQPAIPTTSFLREDPQPFRTSRTNCERSSLCPIYQRMERPPAGHRARKSIKAGAGMWIFRGLVNIFVKTAVTSVFLPIGKKRVAVARTKCNSCSHAAA